MTREELINKVNEVLSEEFEADVADIVDVVVLVEKNFGYVMKKEDFASVKTFADFYDFLCERLDICK